MKIAVITPYYRTPRAWLGQCLDSVARQRVECTHFLVCDGDEPPADLPDLERVEVIRLPRPHGDAGNAARAIGSVSAVSRGFDAIAYLDADNWYEPNHLPALAAVHRQSGAAVCTCGRTLYQPDGVRLGACPEVDGERFVDTNCLLLARPAFAVIAAWYLLPRRLVDVGDRVVWARIKECRLKRAHLQAPTVNYRTLYRAHYEYFGKPAPPGAKVAAPRPG